MNVRNGVPENQGIKGLENGTNSKQYLCPSRIVIDSRMIRADTRQIHFKYDLKIMLFVLF